MRQIGTTFSQSYIESTFSKYPLLAKLVVKMFYTKFEPGTKDVEKKLEDAAQHAVGDVKGVSARTHSGMSKMVSDFQKYP